MKNKYAMHKSSNFEFGGTTFLRNNGKILPDYMASYQRKLVWTLSAYDCLFRVGAKFHVQPVIPLHGFWDRQTLEFELLLDLFNFLSSVLNLFNTKKNEMEKKSWHQRTLHLNTSQHILFAALRCHSESKFVTYSVEFAELEVEEMHNVMAMRSLQTAKNVHSVLFNNGLQAVFSHMAT
jgi:hypothetical protein